MKIVQLVSRLNQHDAVGNEILAMDTILKQQGIESIIMSFIIHESLQDRAQPVDFSIIQLDDIAILHKTNGDRLTKTFVDLPCKKVLVYHNITPAKYFFPYDRVTAAVLALGRRQLRRYASKADMCWADSQYNAEELIKSGVEKAKIAILPIVTATPEEEIKADFYTEQKLWRTKGTKLLYLGRVAPNKKPEDVIKLYKTYQDKYDINAVLYLLGGWDGLEKYYAKLKGFAADLNLREDQIIFAGKVTNEEREAYLQNTDALICLSEHEGFCVPLLEAAKNNLPVLAHSATAVPETLGDSDLLFQQKDYSAMADALAKLRTEKSFKDEVLRSQRENLKRFNPEQIKNKFLQLISCLSEGKEIPEELTSQIPQQKKPSQTKAKEEEKKFKPLWKIHNKTYRYLVKGTTRKRWKRTLSKVVSMIK